MFRKAVPGDLDQIAAIYDAIHTEEETGRATIGWIRAIYPTRQTAADAIQAGDMYVAEEEGRIVASAKIDQTQVPEYADAPGAGTRPRTPFSSSTPWWWTPAIRAGAAPPASYTSTRTWAASETAPPCAWTPTSATPPPAPSTPVWATKR